MQQREQLREALTLDGGPALIAFVTAGYPEPARFLDILREVGEAADAVEIGVPFTDPMADGVTVQRASRAALQSGVSLTWIFDQLASRDFELPAPVLLMSYLNPLYAFGFRRLAERALGDWRQWLHRAGLTVRGKYALENRARRSGSRSRTAGDPRHTTRSTTKSLRCQRRVRLCSNSYRYHRR